MSAAVAAHEAALELTAIASDMATRAALDLDGCERGDHPAIELNDDGLPVCVQCASLVVVHLTQECRCGRGHRVSLLVDDQAVCVPCAADALGIRLREIGR